FMVGADRIVDDTVIEQCPVAVTHLEPVSTMSCLGRRCDTRRRDHCHTLAANQSDAVSVIRESEPQGVGGLPNRLRSGIYICHDRLLNRSRSPACSLYGP